MTPHYADPFSGENCSKFDTWDGPQTEKPSRVTCTALIKDHISCFSAKLYKAIIIRSFAVNLASNNWRYEHAVSAKNQRDYWCTKTQCFSLLCKDRVSSPSPGQTVVLLEIQVVLWRVKQHKVLLVMWLSKNVNYIVILAIVTQHP